MRQFTCRRDRPMWHKIIVSKVAYTYIIRTAVWETSEIILFNACTFRNMIIQNGRSISWRTWKISTMSVRVGFVRNCFWTTNGRINKRSSAYDITTAGDYFLFVTNFNNWQVEYFSLKFCRHHYSTFMGYTFLNNSLSCSQVMIF